MKLIILYMLLSYFVGVETTHAKSATFRFEVPNGIKYIEEQHETIITDFGGKKKRVDTITVKTQIVIKKHAKGYLGIAKILSMNMTMGGKKINNPLFGILSNTEFTYDIDSRGYLTDIKGYETLVEDINKNFPPDIRAKLLKLLTPEAIINKTAAEWNGRIGQFVDKTVKEKDRWEVKSKFPVSRHNLNYYTIITFPKIKQSGNKVLVTIRYAYDITKEGVKDLLSDSAKLLKIPKIKPLIKGKPAIYGVGERVVDAKTMLIESETMHKVIIMKIASKEDSILTKRIETRKYKYKY